MSSARKLSWEIDMGFALKPFFSRVSSQAKAESCRGTQVGDIGYGKP